MGTDVQGTLKTVYALTKIKGVSLSLASSILKKAGVNPDLRVGFLTETDLNKIEEIIREPTKYGLPTWLFNRRKDAETGKDIHLTGPDLEMANREDITKHKKIKSYKGIRHIQGLPVRGQRTRTSFRKGAVVGVSRKKARK